MQHDYVIEDQDGLSFLADLNALTESIVTQNSGATAPAVTYPHMFWADTSANQMKKRNAANTDWVVIGGLDVAGFGSLPAAGGTVTGNITMTGATLIEAEGSNVTAAATTNIWGAGNTKHITGNTTITSFGTAQQAGAWMKVIFDDTPTLTQSANLNLNAGGSNITIQAGDYAFVYADTTTQMDVIVFRKSGLPIVTGSTPVPVRQTVLSGPVDSNGFSSFGGSTGSSTVTMSGPITATAANGTDNRTGSGSNISWTGLSTNGTMYLYVDVNSDGTLTSGAGTLAPSYRWGGADVTTNGQFTFNIQEMQGKLGDGSAATQAYRVYVGEVTVASNVVSAITWYALQGRYNSVFTSTLPGSSTQASFNHNIGIEVLNEPVVMLKNLTTQGGYDVGDIVTDVYTVISGPVAIPVSKHWNRMTASFRSGNGAAFNAMPKAGGNSITLTAANWAYGLRIERGW